MSVPVKKTLDEIREAMFARINAVQNKYAAKGWLPARLNLNKGVIRGLLEIWNWCLYQLYLVLVSILNQAFPESATGAWLDLHAAQVGLTRKPATKTVGTVVFFRDDVELGNIIIPRGRIMRTPIDGQGISYRFAITTEVILPEGQERVLAPVEAEEYGSASNVTPGQIREIVIAIPGIGSVTNESDWLMTEGVDVETDLQLQERYRLAWQDVSGTTLHAYKSWALSVPGVIAAAIIDNHPRGQGTVDVIVKGSAGLPTQELLEAVDEVVEENRPINDNALVRGPRPVHLAIIAELVLVSGDETQILTDADSRVRALFLDPNDLGVAPLQIGQDVPMDLLISTIMSTADTIKNIKFSSPVADTVVPADGLAVLDSLTLTTRWADER
ncbi:baseplate J/gp47 family protein [Maridesulfovibrio bastinii]|uniref:baseplate J/gp47 family protein n=1 Tax=Maridesulfovibrio bastinii TaxID=47157 RepID=UPI000407A863|nr:baseplate J/gp47 family protein [Maridesulfovibrio bastinii]